MIFPLTLERHRTPIASIASFLSTSDDRVVELTTSNNKAQRERLMMLAPGRFSSWSGLLSCKLTCVVFDSDFSAFTTKLQIVSSDQSEPIPFGYLLKVEW